MWKIGVLVAVVALLGTAAYFFKQGYEARARLEPPEKVSLKKFPMQPDPTLPVFDPNRRKEEAPSAAQQVFEDCMAEVIGDSTTVQEGDVTIDDIKRCKEIMESKS